MKSPSRSLDPQREPKKLGPGRGPTLALCTCLRLPGSRVWKMCLKHKARATVQLLPKTVPRPAPAPGGHSPWSDTQVQAAVKPHRVGPILQASRPQDPLTSPICGPGAPASPQLAC